MQRVKKISYCYAKVPHRAGQATKMLAAFADAGVDLLAFSGFPIGGRKAQMDFVPESMPALRRVAKREGFGLSKTKRGFLVQGDDRPGVVGKILGRLAEARLNVIAANAIADGRGRYGMLLWVRPKDYARAARLLKAR